MCQDGNPLCTDWVASDAMTKAREQGAMHGLRGPLLLLEAARP